MMSKIEQQLTMYTREIKRMCINPVTKKTRLSIADRVFFDVCGMEDVATTVFASKKPMAITFNLIKSRHGKCLMKFLAPNLHDARLELVEILNEAIHSTSRKSRIYLGKIYAKAVKRIIKIIGVKIKNKKHSGKYPELNKLIYGDRGYDTFDGFSFYADDDEDDDEEDEIEDDSDIDPDLLNLIERIQNFYKRPLTQAEISEIIQEATCEDDEDEEDEDNDEESDIFSLAGTPQFQNMIDTIATMVVAKIKNTTEGIDAPETETSSEEIEDDLDDFIQKSEEKMRKEAEDEGIDENPTQEETEKSPPKSSDDQEPKYDVESDVISSDPIVDSDNITTEELISKVNNVVDTTADVISSNSNSDIVCIPDEHLTPIYTRTSQDSNVSNEPADEEHLYSWNHYLEKMNKALKSKASEEILQDVINRLSGFISTGCAEYVDSNIQFVPALSEGALIDMNVSVLIHGDPEQLNPVYAQNILKVYKEHVANALGIHPKLIMSNLHILDVRASATEEIFETFSRTSETYTFGDVRDLFNKSFEGDLVDDINVIYNTQCGIVVDFFKKTGFMMKVKTFVNPVDKTITFTVSKKNSENASDKDDAEFWSKIKEEDLDTSDECFFPRIDLHRPVKDFKASLYTDIDIPEQNTLNDQKAFKEAVLNYLDPIRKRANDTIESTLSDMLYIERDGIYVQCKTLFCEIPTGTCVEITYCVDVFKDFTDNMQLTEGATIISSIEDEVKWAINNLHVAKEAYYEFLKLIDSDITVEVYSKCVLNEFDEEEEEVDEVEEDESAVLDDLSELAPKEDEQEDSDSTESTEFKSNAFNLPT